MPASASSNGKLIRRIRLVAELPALSLATTWNSRRSPSARVTETDWLPLPEPLAMFVHVVSPTLRPWSVQVARLEWPLSMTANWTDAVVEAGRPGVGNVMVGAARSCSAWPLFGGGSTPPAAQPVPVYTENSRQW